MYPVTQFCFHFFLCIFLWLFLYDKYWVCEMICRDNLNRVTLSFTKENFLLLCRCLEGLANWDHVSSYWGHDAFWSTWVTQSWTAIPGQATRFQFPFTSGCTPLGAELSVGGGLSFLTLGRPLMDFCLQPCMSTRSEIGLSASSSVRVTPWNPVLSWTLAQQFLLILLTLWCF